MSNLPIGSQLTYGYWRRLGRWLIVFGLLLGGIVLPIIGWLVAVFFLWGSPAWRRSQKWLGTVLLPGGWIGFVFLMFSGTGVRGCSGSAPPGHAITNLQCTSTGLHLGMAVGIPVVALLLFLPLVTTAILARQLNRHGAAAG